MAEAVQHFRHFFHNGVNTDLMKANSKINREWHELHRMPKNATLEQRIAWHMEHAKHCKCRPIPEKLAAEIEKRKSRA